MATQVDGDAKLKALEERMAAYNLHGQWATSSQRPQRVRKTNKGVSIEPAPGGVGHVWEWSKVLPFLHDSLDALTESYTARRTLILTNPGLPRGTTQTLLASIQIIGPGEVAWAHRHTINAFRFTIQGGPEVSTVVDGVPLVMEPYDLVLTPGWLWHDHHNRSDKPAIWLDGLDVPLMIGLNQIFYEEYGEAAQDVHDGVDPSPSPLLRPSWLPADAAPRPFRYAWSDTLARLKSLAGESGSPAEGITLDYVNPVTGGSTLRTLNCRAHLLPPGFTGAKHRQTSSSVFFVIDGEGAVTVEDKELTWGKHDSIAVPNWSWCRWSNRSRTEPALLFSMTDTPMLKAFGLHREEFV
ncbi:MAG: cupin domain-containing protein [Gemmatimonas sp.]